MKKTITLAERTTSPSSAIRTIFQKIPQINAQRQAEGLEPLINLSIGQPHMQPNPAVMEKLLEELTAGNVDFSYSPSQGRVETLDAIIKLYNAFYTPHQFTRENVMVTSGGSQALWNAFAILIQQGDKVATFEPYFSTYRGQIASLGGTLETIPTLGLGFRPDPDALERKLTDDPQVKMVILNYPNNPTGISLTATEAQALAEVLKKHPHVAIVIDDVYRDLNYQQHFTILDFAPELIDRSIIINSAAKGLIGAPDLRVGMLSANPEWIRAMSQQQLLVISGVPVITQLALIHAVELRLSDVKWLSTIRQEYQNNAEFVFKELSQQGFTASQPPQGAFYVFMSAKSLVGKKVPRELQEKVGNDRFNSDVDIVNYLLHAAGVATVPGSGFGIAPAAGYIRISCANEHETLSKAVQQISLASQRILQRSSSLEQLHFLSQRKSQKDEFVTTTQLGKSV